ncbi:DUF2314 domain-containing protein [Melissospora conviva]|uniref:DUF2314 domain-containing protein n=1 Tax=Melissospora conviva TaxID=3388432 RepID=UPI003C1FBF10
MLGTEDFLPVPVPESLNATYLVPVPNLPEVSPATALDAIAERLVEPIRSLARQMLDSPLLTVDTRLVEEFPPLPRDLLTAFGAAEEQLERLDAARYVVVVQAEFRPGWPPAHEWGARAVAAAIATTVGAEIVDVFALRFLDPETALRSLPNEQGRIRLVDWVLVPYSPQGDTLWFTTKGLRRFGLMELQAQGVPDGLARAWGAVMTGAARRLLRHWSEALGEEDVPPFAQLPMVTAVTGHDIAVAYGNPRRHVGTAPVRLRLELDPATDPDGESFLSLLPPEGHLGAPARYFAEACAALFGGEESTVAHAEPDDEMDQAIATARASLPSIRNRFLNGRLPDETQLVVKYALETVDGPEFVWMGVTSWATPERLTGASASDAACDPAVRIGAPVAVSAEDVVDWALLDATGVVEGGWTQAVLDAAQQAQPER